MACIVHHGGAGTSAATFRAGIPGIALPFLGDQPFWSYRAFKLGVIPPPINRRTMTVEQLAGAILDAVCNQAMRDRAAQLGSQIKSENGVACAVEIIEQTIHNPGKNLLAKMP